MCTKDNTVSVINDQESKKCNKPTFIFQEDPDNMPLVATIFTFNSSAVKERKLVPDGVVDQRTLLFG